MTTYERLGWIAIVAGGTTLASLVTIYLHQDAPTPNPFAPAAIIVPAPPSPVHTVDWFKAHRAELKAKYLECRNNPGGMRDPMGLPSGECENAIHAKMSADMEDFINSAPGK